MNPLSPDTGAQPQPVLQLRGVTQSFGAVEVLRDLNLSVARGEFVALVGPSGCGKTTILNLLGGHLQPSTGEVARAARARMVFQQDGLLPWLSARQNIELGVRHLPSDAARDERVGEMLALIGLRDFAEHFPHQLSGGMRQRVELARALVSEAEILLLDEPFGALDYLTRLRLRGELVRLLREFPRTVILVTHDIEEAAHLADRVLVLGDRPAHITRELCLDTPHPRDVTDPAVVDAVRRILSEMGLREGV